MAQSRISPWPILLLWCMLAHAGATAAFAILRHWSGISSLVDLGLFDQVLWSFLQNGIPMYSMVLPYERAVWFGFHFSPIVLALAPLYKAFPFPETLQVLQSLLIAAAAWPVFLACRALRASEAQSFVWALIFLLHPFTMNGAVWDFHEMAFAPLLFAWGMWALAARRPADMLLACLLLVLTKEHYGAAVMCFGFAWGWKNGDWRTGLVLAGMGALAFAIVVFQLMPAFGNGQHIMFTEQTTQLYRYRWVHLPPQEMLAFFLTEFAQDPATYTYLLVMLAPVFFLPLLAPALLLPAAADAAAALLSTTFLPKAPYSYHALGIAPVVAVAACAAAVKLARGDAAKRWFLTGTSAALALVAAWVLSPFPHAGALSPWRIDHWRTASDARIAQIRQLIPANAPLSAQANIGTYFTQRPYIAPFPAGLKKAEYVVLHLEYPFTDKKAEPFQMPYSIVQTPDYVQQAKALLDNPAYGIVYWDAPWLVLHAGGKDKAPRKEVQKAFSALSESLE